MRRRESETQRLVRTYRILQSTQSQRFCHLDAHHPSSSEEATLPFDTSGNAKSAFLFLASDGASAYKVDTHTVTFENAIKI